MLKTHALDACEICSGKIRGIPLDTLTFKLESMNESMNV